MSKKRKRHTPEQIVRKLRDADAMLTSGRSGVLRRRSPRSLRPPSARRPSPPSGSVQYRRVTASRSVTCSRPPTQKTASFRVPPSVHR